MVYIGAYTHCLGSDEYMHINPVSLKIFEVEGAWQFHACDNTVILASLSLQCLFLFNSLSIGSEKLGVLGKKLPPFCPPPPPSPDETLSIYCMQVAAKSPWEQKLERESLLYQ